MKKIFSAAFGALALALALAGCSGDQVNQFAQNTQVLTTSALNLNAALVQVNISIVDNLTAQAKLLAPYQCGAYALGAAIASNPAVAGKVNAYLAKNLAANVANVSVSALCAAAGYPAQVTAAPAAAVVAAGSTPAVAAAAVAAVPASPAPAAPAASGAPSAPTPAPSAIAAPAPTAAAPAAAPASN